MGLEWLLVQTSYIWVQTMAYAVLHEKCEGKIMLEFIKLFTYFFLCFSCESPVEIA